MGAELTACWLESYEHEHESFGYPRRRRINAVDVFGDLVATLALFS